MVPRALRETPLERLNSACFPGLQMCAGSNYDLRLLPSRGGSMIAEFRIESDAAARGVVGWYRLELRQVDDQWKIYGEEKLEPVSRRGGHSHYTNRDWLPRQSNHTPRTTRNLNLLYVSALLATSTTDTSFEGPFAVNSVFPSGDCAIPQGRGPTSTDPTT